MTEPFKTILREANQYLAASKAPSTIDRYRREWKAARESGLGVLEYVSHMAAVDPTQHVIRRSGIIWGLWNTIRHGFVSAARNMQNGLKALAAAQLDDVRRNRVVIDLLSTRELPRGAFTRKGLSKRRSLKGLPADWREIVAEHTIPAALPAVLVTFLSGCRPAELRMGIQVHILDADHLTITICGAKTNDDNGQPWRRLTIATQGSPLTLQLWRMASVKGGALWVKREPRTLHKNLVAAAKHAGLPAVCAYMARHYLASQLKNFWGKDAKQDIARVLGHASTSTQKMYGSAQQGRRGAMTIVKVEAARLVRTPDRPHYVPRSAVASPLVEAEHHTPWTLSDPSPYDFGL
jgi:hypothetical protein